MSYLTTATFNAAVARLNSKYWNEGGRYRWLYMSYVIDQLKRLKIRQSRLCEAGASGMPLSSESYRMDYPQHDLNCIPYRTIENIPLSPIYRGKFMEKHTVISDKYFDCFIALQVWEHLDKQAEAFREVMRISKYAILSFPYKWPRGKGHDKRHVGIDDRIISRWTCGVRPIDKKLIHHRMVMTWRF